MKYKGEFIFDATADMVWEAREKRFENPDKFPELQHQELIERTQKGNVIRQKRKIELSASVPPALRAILPAEMLKCIDISEYDLDAGTHKFMVRPNFKTDVFKCYGTSKYTEFTGDDGKPRTKRELELSVEVKVPIVGKQAEKVILDGYKKNVERDNESIRKMIGIMKQS